MDVLPWTTLLQPATMATIAPTLATARAHGTSRPSVTTPATTRAAAAG